MLENNSIQEEKFFKMDIDLHLQTNQASLFSPAGGKDLIINDDNIESLKRFITMDFQTFDIFDTDDETLPLLGLLLKFDTQTKPFFVLKSTPFVDEDVQGVSVGMGSYEDLYEIIYPYINLHIGNSTFSSRHIRHLSQGKYDFEGFDNRIYFNSEFDEDVANSTLRITKVIDGTDVFDSKKKTIDLSSPGSYIVTIGTIDYSNIVTLPIGRPHVPWFSYKLTVI